jgi:uncharacterized damage-inducible protein DinB
MTSVLHELFRHKTWATLKLIEFCQSLPAEHLDATLPGTYGSVRATLAHLANAESSYYSRLRQQPSPEPFDRSTDLETIAERIRSMAPGWEALLDDPAAPDLQISGRAGTSQGVVVLAQAIHHADDHRTHVLSILGARGVEVPQLDLWAYGAQAGMVRPATPA